MLEIPEDIRKYIIYWKTKYGSVYSAHIEDVYIVYRGLSLKEMITLQEYGTIDDIFDSGIVNLCVLAPDPLPLKKAGSYVVLAEKIRESSGWEDPDQMVASIKEKKDKLKEDTFSIVCNQLAEFFKYDQEHVERMTFDQFTYHCALFELITNTSFFDTKVKDKKNEVLSRLGAQHESPVDLPGSVGLSDYQEYGMARATDALAQRTQSETPDELHKNPPKIFDWQNDLKEIKRQSSE